MCGYVIDKYICKNFEHFRNNKYIIGGEVPRSNLEPHAEVLLTLNKTCIEWTAQWLRVAFEKHGALFTISQAQKDAFVKNVLRERTNKRMCELLQNFSLQNLSSANNWNVMTRKQ